MAKITDNLTEAVDHLRQQGVCALPTETVYGLAGGIGFSKAIERIYQLKARPSDHPLIIHVLDWKQAQTLCGQIPPIAKQVIAQFTPGPLTLILPANPKLPQYITRGNSTIAIRATNHSIMREAILQVQQPLAAPSANLFSKLTGAHPEAIAAQFADAEDLLILRTTDPLTSAYGIESSIIDFSTDTPKLLRRGMLDEQLSALIPNLEYTQAQKSKSPGSHSQHYQPNFKIHFLNLTEQENIDISFAPDDNHAFMIREQSLNKLHAAESFKNRCKVMPNTPTDFARKLYGTLWELEQQQISNLHIIWDTAQTHSSWLAILDRLQRAASQ